MDWHFVGRAEHLERIRSRLAEREPDPLVVVGEPGIGRTSVVRKALASLDPGRDALLEVRPGGHEPFSSLRHLLPSGAARPAGRDAVREVADAVRALAAGRRPVLLADDAHLADHETMLVLQHLNRHAGAFLLLTHPIPAPRPGGGDPVDCLRYERGIQTVRLPPLSVDEVGAVLARLMEGPVRSATTEALHAATAGNPGLLHDIVVRQELRGRMVRDGGRWRLADAPPAEGPALTCRGVAHLLAAVARAWESLALDQVEDLCRLAAWSGAGGEVALVKAAVHLLRGRAAEAFAALDGRWEGSGGNHGGGAGVGAVLDRGGAGSGAVLERGAAGAGVGPDDPHPLLLRAMCLAFGRQDPAEADAFLAAAAAASPHRERLHAYRGWLLAVAGRASDAADVLAGLTLQRDRHAALFAHAAEAIGHLELGRGAAAVAHLRRALVLAEADRAVLPWMAPYLRAYLIDALLLAGRITEATSLAGEFHAAAPDCGWKVAVAMAALTAAARTDDAPVS
ncbi:AAA family ATPase [Amycolatopsis vancoresmycina]|uniref:Regulatory protein LuxR n=1 Tax=Amycolatopsis vancoresmycina DSM 44592 TaxID=1292037 RepID=R1IAC0_9PSEU|nr:AAA family ATPase [Amycolatopsis vancoresmycina]EOD67349.1 regulatory protein LuxR [Amycolatopsis vancoresmycina DSM 44592]